MLQSLEAKRIESGCRERIVVVNSVGIVGLGLIGGSLTRRLAHGQIEIIAWNHNDRPYPAARDAGINCVDSLEQLAAAKPQVLFLCNPLKAMPEILERLAPVLDRDATVLSDVGSVKTMVRQQVEDAGLDDCYVGAHPMAGNESSGFTASDPTIYDGALWALTVNERTDYRRFLEVATLITESVGNHIIVLDDATHDRAAAMISHAPHAVSTALINQLTESSERNIAAALAAGSWRDMTRVALTDPDRTRAMIEEDAENVEVLLRDLAARLTLFADELHRSDDAAVTHFFEQGQPFRDYKASERTATDMADLKVKCTERRVMDIPDSEWRSVFLDSARRGEHVVRFIHPRRVEVETLSKI
jgi:prephenate dehydrogenase